MCVQRTCECKHWGGAATQQDLVFKNGGAVQLNMCAWRQVDATQQDFAFKSIRAATLNMCGWETGKLESVESQLTLSANEGRRRQRRRWPDDCLPAWQGLWSITHRNEGTNEQTEGPTNERTDKRTNERTSEPTRKQRTPQRFHCI